MFTAFGVSITYINHYILLFQVFLHKLATENNLVGSSPEFEAAMQSGERSSLRLLCDKKSQESEYLSTLIFFICISFVDMLTFCTYIVQLMDVAEQISG